MNLKNLERYLRVNLLGPGRGSCKKRIYRAAVSQIMRNTAIEDEVEKGKVSHVHAMERCRGSSGIAPLIFNLDPS